MSSGVCVKVCGITRSVDAAAAVDAGVDAVGLNFVSASTRCIDIDGAREVLAVGAARLMTVGIFLDQSVEECCTSRAPSASTLPSCTETTHRSSRRRWLLA